MSEMHFQQGEEEGQEGEEGSRGEEAGGKMIKKDGVEKLQGCG